MAIQMVCAVRDSAVGEFMQPMFAPHQGAIIRSFADEVNRAESPMHAHPEDYELWLVGAFDSEKGQFQAVDSRCLSRGVDVLRKTQ